MTRFNAAADPKQLIRDLEQWVQQQYPLRTVRITGRCEELLGLFLLAREVQLTEHELQTALAGVFEGVPISEPPAAREDETDSGRFEQILASQIEHTRKTRLPCALILLEIDALAESPPAELQTELKALVQGAVRRSDILLECHLSRLAIILPSISLREATDCGERIRQTLAGTLPLEGDKPELTASMGIGIYYAGDRIPAGTFAAKVARELERARQQGGNRICWTIDSRADCACQVSVEERAELFSIFLKDRRS